MKMGKIWNPLALRKPNEGKHENYGFFKNDENAKDFVSHAKGTWVVYSSEWTMREMQTRRVPRWKFSTAMNTDCASHLIISNIPRICSLEHQWLQKELFIILFYWFPPSTHHHDHFLQLLCFWRRLMVVLSLSPRPHLVPLFQPNEDGCGGKTVQMYVLAGGDRHWTICKN